MTTFNETDGALESTAALEGGRPRRRGIWPYLAAMGPGLIAANAGNDAGGIATYASAGASYGYGMLWVMVVIFFFLGTVQEMFARLGTVTGKGFSDLVRENFSLRMTAFILLALFVANFGVIVTEFVGIGAAAELFGVSRYIAVPVAAVLLWVLITRGSYSRVEKIFLIMTLIFLCYVGAAFLGKPDWHVVLEETIRPQIQTDPGYLNLLIALIGTTITPYMQLYVQSTVVEKGVKLEDYRFTQVDVWSGTFFAVAISAFIIIATAATLFPIHKEVETAADAALALAPVAGPYAEYLFAIGLLGACLLAGAVLPLSTTYVMSEAAGFERGVSRSWSEAPIFLGMFTALLVLGAALALIPNLPVIPVLLGVQVLNGVLLPIELFAVLKLVNNRELMGSHVNGPIRNLMTYSVAIVVSVLSLILIVITVLGWLGVDVGG
ncbi:MAG: NRAMP (natural resistance-associated macrophage protein)-like metal ion transporter [Candidatus Accumulibacter regalis]|jgi:NRAMP (natural resistance-associated macrophage protein)-like metal ion transporter